MKYNEYDKLQYETDISRINKNNKYNSVQICDYDKTLGILFEIHRELHDFAQ